MILLFYISCNSYCKAGHVGKRRTNNSGCMICEKHRYVRLTPDFSPRILAKMSEERYFRSGKDCVNGHTDPLRATINSTCCECVTARARAKGVKERRKGIGPRKYVKRIRKTVAKKAPKIIVYKEVRITEEEIKAETFEEMTKRIYAEDRKW